MTPKKEQNMTPEELREAIAESEARTRRLTETWEKKQQEEYLSLCRQIAEFALDLSDLDAQPVVDFRRRMAEKKYEAAAKILTHELNTAADNAPARAARKDQEQARKKGKKSTGLKTETGA